MVFFGVQLRKLETRQSWLGTGRSPVHHPEHHHLLANIGAVQPPDSVKTTLESKVWDELSTRAGEADPHVVNAVDVCKRRRLHLRAQSVATWTTSFTSSVRESLRASTLTFRRTGAAAPERGSLVMRPARGHIKRAIRNVHAMLQVHLSSHLQDEILDCFGSKCFDDLDPTSILCYCWSHRIQCRASESFPSLQQQLVLYLETAVVSRAFTSEDHEAT